MLPPRLRSALALSHEPERETQDAGYMRRICFAQLRKRVA